MKMQPTFLLLPLLLCGCADEDPLQDPELRGAAEAIDPQAIRAHMEQLADDALEGRGAGSRGYLLAADYVANAFREIGLRPAGDQGGFHQQVPLASTELLAAESSLQLVREEAVEPLEMEVDYVLSGDFLRERGEIEAPVAYVGFGVSAPELEYDDYAGIDVRGKVVALFRGAPSTFPHNERAYHASSEVKASAAVRHGAAGVLQMLLPDERAGRPWDRTVRHGRMASMRWIGEGGLPHGARPELFVEASLNESGERKLFAGAALDFAEAVAVAKEGRAGSFDLPPRIVARTASRHARLESPNVIGVLEGSDPNLALEYVVLTAHLDHVGVGQPVDGDGIHNGAYDNASGVAILLEVAHALAALPAPPRRSVLFLAVTAEEKGLLGSDYWTHKPTVPLDAVVANVNLDMVMMLHPLRDVVAFGAEHSTLQREVEIAARAFRVELSPDPIPDEVFFVRSDQFPFVRKGVPSLFLISGMDGGEGDGLQEFRAWMRTTYHTPADDMSQPFDLEAGAQFARVNFLLAWEIAMAAERPQWNPGDFFGERFGAR